MGGRTGVLSRSPGSARLNLGAVIEKQLVVIRMWNRGLPCGPQCPIPTPTPAHTPLLEE